MTVTLTKAQAEQAPLLQNLFQFYVHDFSEFWAGTPKGDLLPDGRFEPYPLDDYWARPDWSAWLIRSDGALAGFALINDVAHSSQPVDHSVAEFFILRKHRGGGVAQQAARALFALHPGSWEAAVARKNVKAERFWRRAIEASVQATNVQMLDLANEHWNGPIFRFDWLG